MYLNLFFYFRRSEIKEEMKCAVHQKLKSNHIESKHPNRQRLPGTQYQVKLEYINIVIEL